ncbi:ankyrin repeat-containing domain protein [Mycena latifolia]|nr:ankyrin repeat-containing domain protein [Mycena latifolia]
MKPFSQFRNPLQPTSTTTSGPTIIPLESQVTQLPIDGSVDAVPHHRGFKEWLRDQKDKALHSADQLDSQQLVHAGPAADSKATDSVGNNFVDNLALAAELCEKIANVVDKAPFVAPLAALVSTILKTCKEIEDTKGHRNDLFKRITKITSNLHGAIMRMETTQYEEDTGRLTADMEEYARLIKKASALVSDFDAGGKLKITVTHTEWESKLTALDHELDSFAAQFNVNRGTDIQIGQSVIRKKVDEVQVSDLATELREWLQLPSDMGTKHGATQKLHLKGTGSWFLDGVQFKEWQETPGSLWLEGQSGAGKTVLSSTVIEKLLTPSNPETIPAYAVAYFYFDFRNEETQLMETMLRFIVFQLSKQSPSPYATLDHCYKTRKGITPPTSEDLQNILDKLLIELGPTYIVLDALDECKDTTLVIQFISTLQNSSLHLLFTSQYRTEFAEAFNAVTHVILRPETTRDDIKCFVESELRTPKLKHWARHTAEITRKVVEKSNGMFRLAACLLIELSRRKTVRNSDTILANLPSDLFEIYDRFLQPIHADDLPAVGILFRWLLFSAERITLPQLEDALAFDFHPHEHVFQPAKRGDYASFICESLEGLVTVGKAPSMGNEAPAVVALAHASVADYLMSRTFTEKHECNLSSGISHSFLAQSCVGYLLHFADNPLNATTLPDYPLASYAARYWIHHLFLCDDRDALSSSTVRLLESGSGQYTALNNLHNYGWVVGDWNREAPVPLFMCSIIGYTEGVRFLLEKGTDVDTADRAPYITALQAASSKGHTEIVRLLLEKGADINAGAGHTYTPLQRASEEGHTEVVRLLLEKGADINAGSGFTPLQWASMKGYTEMIRLLLEKGANINAGHLNAPLEGASEAGHIEIVRLLLEKGADINKGDVCTPLQRASEEGHTEVVRLLLEKGADINAGRGFTPLQRASMRGHTEIVRLLLENGADINAGGDNSPLQLASWKGHTEIVCLLLEKGADFSAGKDALQLASIYGHTEIVQLLLAMVRFLLEKGTDVDTADRAPYITALQAASSKGHTEIVRLLLEKGADINAGAGHTYTPLQRASEEGHTEVVHLLLEKGADINAGSGFMPLQQASMRGHTEIVHLLLEKGADINAGNDNSPLQLASWKGHTEIVRLLLEKGADFNAGKDTLQLASIYGHTEIVQLLLAKGADGDTSHSTEPSTS